MKFYKFNSGFGLQLSFRIITLGRQSMCFGLGNVSASCTLEAALNGPHFEPRIINLPSVTALPNILIHTRHWCNGSKNA